MVLFWIFSILWVGSVVYGVLYPHKNMIYKDRKGEALVKVTDIHKMTIELVFVEFNEAQDTYTDITNYMNIGFFEFIKTFKLWDLSC